MSGRTAALVSALLCFSSPVLSQLRYYRGSIHVHTSLSDGSLNPSNAVTMYQNLGYDFCAITDHNRVMNTATLNPGPSFVVISGEEVSDYYHVNALDIDFYINPLNAINEISRIARTGAVLVLNHPRWPPAVDPKWILQQPDLNLMEIHNAVVQDQEGYDDQHLWDQILSAGKKIFGVASDDAHKTGDFGKAWIMLRSPALSRESLMQGIKNGDFYCSTGITLDQIEVLPRRINIVSHSGNKIRFIGQNRTVLDSTMGTAASYVVTGKEGYIRVEASNAADKKAWTQPLIYYDYTQPCVLVVSGDHQIQYVTKPLAQSLKVQIKDVLDRPLSGKAVEFRVISGDAHFNSKKSYTAVSDANGMAQATPVMGQATAPQKNIIMVSVKGAINPVEFYATAVKENTDYLLAMAGGGQIVKANQLLAVPARVLYWTTDRNTQANRPIVFAADNGALFENNLSCDTVLTDRNGEAAIRWRAGKKRGPFTVTARLARTPSLLCTFSYTAEPTDPMTLAKVSGDQQIAYAAGGLAPFKVCVTDTFGNPVFAQPVEFLRVEGDGAFNYKAKYTIDTDKNGFAAAIYSILTTKVQMHRVQVSCMTGQQPLQNSPIGFTAFFKNRGPDSLRLICGDRQVGVIGQPLPSPLQVQVITDIKWLVRGHPVLFKSLTQGATVDGRDSVLVVTDAQGMARVIATLGPTVGIQQHKFIVSAYRTDGKTPLFGSPLQLVASARRSLAAKIKSLSPPQFQAVAGSFLVDSVRVQILDDKDTAVSGHPVAFRIEGGGRVNLVPDSIRVFTSSLGIAAVRVQAGATARAVKLSVGSDDGLQPLSSSPTVFNISVRPATPSSANSVLTVAPIAGLADGKTLMIVNLKLKDRYGNAVANAPVALRTEGVSVQVQPAASQTNESGEWQANITSIKVGAVKIWCVGEQGNPVSDTCTVSFVAGATAKTTLLGDGQRAVHLSMLPAPVGIRIFDDNDNPVSNLPVYFNVATGGGRISVEVVRTDSTGTARVNWQLGEAVGEQTLAIRFSENVPPVFLTGVARLGPVNNFAIFSGDGQKAGKEVLLADSLCVVAHDSCGHAAPGQAITFREYDDGLLLGANPVVTNRHGRAAIRVRTGSTIGEHVIAAYLSPSDSLRFHFTVISPAVLIRSASAMIPSESRPLQELAVAVKVVDRDGTVRPGVKVDFSVQQGDGVLREPGFAISDAQGNVIAHWQLGRLGRQSLTAWIDGYIEETEVWETMVANSAPRFQMPDTLRFRVGDINQRSIQATDSDGDSVSILCSPLPKGAAYDSLNKTVLWQPFPRDLGLYPVWWYAADNFGSRDSLKMFFHVYKQNRPPALLSRHPADSMLFIPYQRLMNFSIDVKDDDLDSLAFQWSVNGQALQQNREQSVFFSPTFPKETVLRIEVSDGEALLAIRWQIKLSATGLEKSDLAVIPSSWNLYQNYPNPFNSRTRIMFDVPEPDFVSVKIFSLTGDEIITLVNSRVVAGRYGVSWDACNSAGGVYLCVLRSSTVQCFHKLILLR